MNISEKEIYKIVGKRIKALRENASLTQLDLAELCNMEKANISRIERGATNITIKTLYKISVSLNVTMYDIFKC